MKKLALAAVAAAAMMAGGAQAYTAGTFSNGVVVPNVIHNGSNLFTGVGLINQSGAPVSVYWTFFNQDSGHVTDSCFTMTDKDYQGFVWNDATAGLGLADQRGYLVFASSTNTGCTDPATAGLGGSLAAHAFTVDTAAQDVAYLPVIDGPLTIGTPNLSTLDATSLTAVGGAASFGDTLNMRYFLDAGANTNIVVWSTGDQSGVHTVNMFDDKQNRKSVNFNLTHTELDWFDPSTIPGRPANFVDGFIEWDTTDLTAPGSIFSYSVINAPAWGATQSVLGFHY
ncbi:MAG: hypothetical protein ABS45_14445 [Comamonas sp. SCN 65-56]|uniref:hypothetical protein n=1 Tax=Comamonas sp. SCN 65-56 TaxID=1660095 RepID=UPI00086C7B09|nr:hypothetical protein [Comamonas sp. SCN 65-56]ODS90846.1 MAG: hypothetical protein ABS45_14445 [Comamonas sp. SCN 65-56]